MKSHPILILATCLLALCAVSAMPQRRHAKSQRQVEYSSTPYPAAGFRPRVPFNLPGELQPQLETEPLTTTTTTTSTSTTTPSEVQPLESTEPLSTTEQQESETEAEAEAELSVRTPANTYGAPEEQDPLEPDTVEVVAQEPARDFQPPSLESVEDFAAAGTVAAGSEQPVADVPALGQADSQDSESEPELIAEAEVKAVTPAGTYGPPAATYGVPELSEPENELDLEESQVELVDEEAAAEETLTNELASGRLILLPLGARGARFGRLVLAVEQPRQRLRSERLRRI
ncbi:uncharacterized protein LOC128259759 [Drosophila gunungcola]|uniref:DUF4794 domain-containing protein n=1 Tax=Drosophila gunungcola TaxID=103775 RepID=A0A9P9YJC3_9MUSC|nr:uncharacterized protein LOC128259759 [Drosophila gunungcola]KAI8037876.1 hypothetical protein M5D96_009377 [Drosophila gunungcola]